MKYKISNSWIVKIESITYMKRALELAKKGLGTVTPNPMVGAVIVKNGKVIGEGYHKVKGGPHAEVNAINNSVVSVEGADVYCTLEPCCHTNKLTPPCTNLLIEKKVKRVFIACLDPNPEVAGKGVKKLQENGIEVYVGLLNEEAIDLNKVFFKYITTQMPYVHLKMATTLDGKMFSKTGSSKWITSETARDEVHLLRKSYDAVWVGMNTLLSDNPALNSRLGTRVIKENKKIVIGDLKKMNNKNLQVLSHKDLLFGINTSSESVDDFESFLYEGNLEQSLKWLGSKGITSILVEGGSKLVSELIEKELYDEMSIYIAPKLIGNGSGVYENELNLDMEKALKLKGSWRILDSNEAVYEVKK